MSDTTLHAPDTSPASSPTAGTAAAKLAMAVKANALFLPGIVVAVVLLGRTPEPWRGQKPKLFGVLTLAGGLGALKQRRPPIVAIKLNPLR